MGDKLKLTEEKANRIAEHFNALVKSRGWKEQCPLCGDTNFRVHPAIVPLPVQDVYPNPMGVPQNNHYTCAPLICFTCGNTFLLNLRILDGDSKKLEDIYDPKVTLRDF